MSTNPNTKTYRRRVERLARTLAIEARHDYGLKGLDGLPPMMKMAVIEAAIGCCEWSRDMARQEIAEQNYAIQKLKDLGRTVKFDPPGE